MEPSWDSSANTVFFAMTNTPKRNPRGRKQKATGERSITRTSQAPALPVQAQPQSSAARKKVPTRKRVRIGDALRRRGLDEWTIAEGYVDVVGKLSRKSDANDSVEKLFVDVLKECSRHLEPPHSADDAPDAPVIVRLV